MITDYRVSAAFTLASLMSQIFSPGFGLDSITQADEYIFSEANGAITIQGQALVSTNKPIVDKVVQNKYVIVTAYSSTVGQTDDTPFITASGTTVRDGIVACNFLRIGTRVRFPDLFGNKEFIVEDRMALKNSHKIDIWFESYDQAKQFGVKRLKVEVLEI